MTITLDGVATALMALLAIMNPIGAAPIFLEITADAPASTRRKDATRASLVVVAILVVSAVAGAPLLRAFGITVDALRAAGGLIIILMGLEMLGGTTTRLQSHIGGPNAGTGTVADAEDTLIVPFAMPLVAGPGAITTAITLSAHGGIDSVAETVLAILVASAALWTTLVGAGAVGRRVSRRGHAILLRFLGIVLASIGVQYLLEGARGVLQ